MKKRLLYLAFVFERKAASQQISGHTDTKAFIPITPILDSDPGFCSFFPPALHCIYQEF